MKGTQELSSKLQIGGNLNYIDDRGRYALKGSQLSGVMLGSLRTPPNFDNANYLNANGTQRVFRFPNASSNDAAQQCGVLRQSILRSREPGQHG